jgi:hypothetical protein
MSRSYRQSVENLDRRSIRFSSYGNPGLRGLQQSRRAQAIAELRAMEIIEQRDAVTDSGLAGAA